MKKIMLLLALFAAYSFHASAQEIIKGLANTASLVPKSQRIPSIKNKDGSTLVLSYNTTTGINVMMGKNGKNYPFCDPFTKALMVQVGEKDIDGDGKPELLVGSRPSDQTVEVMIYKKAEFETEYKYWTTVNSIASVEFPGNGTVKLYDNEGKAGTYQFTAKGELIAVQ